MSKTNNVYSRDLKLEIEYTYDSKHNIVYDFKRLNLHYKNIVAKLKRK